MPEAIAIYDEQCGFCRCSIALVLLWDRGRRVRPLALRTPEADALLAGLSEERRLASWHLKLADRPLLSAGPAAAPLLRLLPGGAPLALLAERHPRRTRAGYWWVATRRTTFGPLIPGVLRRRADALVQRRTDELTPALTR